MCWGFSHNNGWFFLIDALCHCIQSHINNPPYVYKKTFRVYCLRAWNSLVRICHLPLRWICYGSMYEQGPKIQQVVAAQVKEKFGGLRFYYEGGDDVVKGMVCMAEAMAYRTCEDCGVMNEVVNQNSDGWIKTTCPACSHSQKSHVKNKELVELWKQVRKDDECDRNKQAV